MSLSAPALSSALSHLAQLDIQNLLYHITAQTAAERAAENGAVSENLSAAQMPDDAALSVELRGLVPMQGVRRTSILYAEPGDESLRLQALGERLRREFTRGGWMVEDKRGLRLHATVVNTIYARGRKGKGRGRGEEKVGKGGDGVVDGVVDGKMEGEVEGEAAGEDGESTAGETIDGDGEPTTAPPDPSTVETKVGREPEHGNVQGGGKKGGRKELMRFDATELVERYKDFVWAENVRIDRVQICKMGAKKIFNESGEVVDEEYEVVGEKIIAPS